MQRFVIKRHCVPSAGTCRTRDRRTAHRQVADLKGQTDKDILMFGSHTLWSDLLANG
jgi:hypothetical protein